MHKKQKIRFLKICGLMFAILCLVILTVALLDPNLKNFPNNSSVHILNTESPENEPSKNSSVASKNDISSSENKSKNNKDTNKKENSKDDYDDIILRNPNKYGSVEFCEKCNGTGYMPCPSCIGAGASKGSACMICFGNGKIPCDYCQ